MKIYYHDNEPSDSRLPHTTTPTLPESILAPLGIQYDFCPPNDTEESSARDDFRDPPSSVNAADFSKQVPHLSTSHASDIITISPASMGDAYEAQIQKFYEEHMHDDEEIRWILEGSGYFDVRDADDRWVRIEVQKGDVLTLPAGIYHRFTVDEKNYIRAKRFFRGKPNWMALYRGEETEKSDVHKEYLLKRASGFPH
ncbi:MAG: hypothetical protein L6R36_005518 [Xanthoria steineri]|nr:MAG: hypothetical protein L6R36_005518 [Xanthoria steineri]